MDPEAQLERLRPAEPSDAFAERLRRCGAFPLRAGGVGILQLHVTRKCNLSCRHCHVGAGPGRTLHMDDAVLERCLQIAAHPAIHTLDLTGGAPELHPRFRELVERLAGRGKRLLVRSNLVILLDPAFEGLTAFFARHGVELVASLPDAHGPRTDRQRGSGVFRGVIEAIRRLNALGYGQDGSGLVLDLVHNPAGAFLPAGQDALEAGYRRVLRQEHGVEFNRLYCLTNCPLGRFLEYLERSGNLAGYLRDLRAAFNPAAAAAAMCRTTLSVAPDGGLYDCDFNQVLGLPVNGGAPAHVFAFDYDRLASREIVVRDHCFACTAGAGSSCQGVTA